jgi:2-phospho-L-lactate guanylyltransferase
MPDPLFAPTAPGSRWRAIVPLKQGASAKSRLAGVLDAAGRRSLAERMARHVLAVLAAAPQIAEVELLSPLPLAGWPGAWRRDPGEGLNPALDRWRRAHAATNLLVVHADLPWLGADDVANLLEAAETAGAALATDRAGLGSNALALRAGTTLGYCFGPDSRRLHACQVPGMAVLTLRGLACDIDTADDLADLAVTAPPAA